MRVSAGQPIKSAHINALDARIDAIQGGVATNSTGYPLARVEPYRTVPDFSGTMHPGGTVSVSPGTVYVNGNIVEGDEIPYRHTSITGYTSSACNQAADGLTAWLSGYAKWRDDELTAVFKIVWTSSPDSAPKKENPGDEEDGGDGADESAESDFNFYAFPIFSVKTNAAGVMYVYQYFTGPQYLTIQTGETVLAQYLAMDVTKPDTPGIIAGIQRIPADEWTANATTNVDGTYDLTTSGVERIEDGVIYLREPIQHPLAQYLTGDTTKPDTPGKISAIKRIPYTAWAADATTNVDGTIDLSTTGIEKIEDGVIYLREPVQHPLANYIPNYFDEVIGDPTSATPTPGIIRAVYATSSVDGIPRIINGDIFLPAANFHNEDNNGNHDTPGIITGIDISSAVDAPAIIGGHIYLPVPSNDTDAYTLHGVRTTSGTCYPWADMMDGAAYKIGQSPTWGQTGTDEIHPTATYAVLHTATGDTPENGHRFLSLIVMVGSSDTLPATLDSLISDTYTLHT